jgi:chromosome segregation ATPase
MELLTILWGASVLGAGSFFASGLATQAMLARRRPGASEVVEPSPTASQPQLVALEASLARAAFDARAHGERANALDAALVRSAQDVRTQAERASALELSLARVGDEARANLERASALEASLTKAKQELEKQRARATTLESSLARANDEVAAQRQRAGAIESSQGQRRVEQDAQVERARVLEVELRRTQQTGKRVELELAEVRRALAAAEQRAEESSTRAGSLAQQLEDAVAERTRVVMRARASAPQVVVPRAADVDTVEANLAACLGTLADECGYEVVVLSDAQGLLLAGVGDEQVQSTVAALSSVARELTTRAAEFVALQPVLLEVTDEAGRTLRIRLFQWEQESIALASFGAGRIEPTRQEETVITVFPTLMAAS